MPDRPYVRIDVARVTHRNAPPYGTITFSERNTKHVLMEPSSGKVLIGPIGVHYYQDGKPTSEAIYLRRWDVQAQREPITVLSHLPRDWGIGPS